MSKCGSKEGESDLPLSELDQICQEHDNLLDSKDKEIQQLRADLAARERENEELRAQVEGLRLVVSELLDVVGKLKPGEPILFTVGMVGLLPALSKLRMALSRTPAEHASQAFREGMERAAEMLEAEAARRILGGSADGLRALAKAIRAEAVLAQSSILPGKKNPPTGTQQ